MVFSNVALLSWCNQLFQCPVLFRADFGRNNTTASGSVVFFMVSAQCKLK